MIDQKFRVHFKISQPANIPQKWFSTQNDPVDVGFQIRLTQPLELLIFVKINRNHGAFFQNVLKRLHHGFA